MQTSVKHPHPLPAALREALEGVRVDEGAEWRISVGDRRVEAESTRELRIALGNTLYEEWHAGVARDDGRTRLPTRDHAFEARLAGVTPHDRTPVEGVLRSEPTGPGGDPVVVEFGRVLVRVPPQAVRPCAVRDGDTAVPGNRVTVDMPAVRPALSPGFLLVDGPDGKTPAGRGDEVLRLYVHVVDPKAAPRVWGALLMELAAGSVPYRAKVLSRPWSYPRRDAVVVYLGAAHAGMVLRLAESVRDLPGVGSDTSVFAHRLAPGVAVAWDPRDSRPGWEGKSFGQHRAAAVADGVIRYVLNPAGTERGTLEQEVTKALQDASAAGVEPARNVTSPSFPSLAG